MVEETKEVMDIAAGTTAVATLAAWLPPVASLFTIVWFGIRIWESDTVQQLTGKSNVYSQCANTTSYKYS